MTVQECIERYEKYGIETIINDGVVKNENSTRKLWTARCYFNRDLEKSF